MSLRALPRAVLLVGAALGPSLLLGDSAAPRGEGPPPVGVHAAGRPYADGPPLAVTGGFGEATCHSCHNELELNQDGSGTLSVEGLPDQYEPGSTYVVTVVVNSEGMVRAGFEAAFRFVGSPPPGRQAGSMSAVDERVAVGHLGLTPVFYAYHTRAGSVPPATDLATWTFEWVAPTSSDPVALHLVANSANGDNSPLGDFILTRSDTLRAR